MAGLSRQFRIRRVPFSGSVTRVSSIPGPALTSVNPVLVVEPRSSMRFVYRSF
jgi:hypothetical protein